MTQGVTSSIDISPGQGSFGFDMQRVHTQIDTHGSQGGLGKLIEHMDQDNLRHSFHSSQKSIEQRAAEKMKRRQLSMNSSKDNDRDRASSKENGSIVRSILRDERLSDKNDQQAKPQLVERVNRLRPEESLSNKIAQKWSQRRSTRQTESSKGDPIAEVSVLQPTESQPGRKTRPELESALKNSQADLGQMADELVSKSSQAQPKESSISNSSRFKNQYLNIYNSNISKRPKKDENLNKQMPGHKKTEDGDQDNKPWSSNPYVEKNKKDQDPLDDNRKNQSTQQSERPTSAFQHKNSAPVQQAQDSESRQNPLETNPSTNKDQEEDQDIVDPNNLRGSIRESRDPQSSQPTRTERPNTKSNYLNIHDNSSNKNTAKYTDGTASDIPHGFSGRGIAPFNKNTGTFSGKKGSLVHHKTEREVKPKNNRRNPRDQNKILDDEDLMLASAPPTRDSKPRRSGKKSASYLNMTSSFKSKVEGNFRLSQGPQTDLKKSFTKSFLTDNKTPNSKPSSFLDQGLRSGGGRQPKQKRNNKRMPTQGSNEREYVSFGNSRTDLRNDRENAVSADVRMSKIQAAVDRLSSNGRSSHCDHHCYDKHPDNWRWHANPPKEVAQATQRHSRSNSPSMKILQKKGLNP